MLIIGIAAGFVGSLTGLGGAVVILPALVLLFGTPIQYATGASLVSTIATSSGAAAAYVKDRISNIRIGMSLEVGTTLGAIGGALLAAFVYSHNLSFIILIAFGIVLLSSVYGVLRHKENFRRMREDWSTRLFQLRGDYYDSASKRRIRYTGVRWWFGEIVMFFAGIISGLLGIGSGVLKVLAMDSGMNLPIKVSTATSDFMIGVTAVTGSAIYWALGYIEPLLVAPIIIGVIIGSYFGSKVMKKTQSNSIRMIFALVLTVIAVEMIIRGVTLI